MHKYLCPHDIIAQRQALCTQLLEAITLVQSVELSEALTLWSLNKYIWSDKEYDMCKKYNVSQRL